MSLTKDQKATNFETYKHINKVRNYIDKCCFELLLRGSLHDQSKLKSPEVECFTEFTSKLANCTYGSDEYRQNMKEMKPAIDHHNAHNPHHPENHKNGINDMSLIDLIELICDWKAASERHNDGNIKKSIEYNANRFNISPQLVNILENTVKQMFG